MPIAGALCLVVLSAGIATGQSPGHYVFIDLSGPWKVLAGSRVDAANPALDDSSWRAVNLPAPYGFSFLPEGWLRRTVQLPAGVTAGTRLTITIASLPYAYEVYANGSKLEPETPWDLQTYELPRPRYFDFPAGTTSRLVIALHLRALPRTPAAWLYSAEPGPLLLTAAEVAPRREALHVLAWQRVHRMGDMAQALVLLCLTVIVLLIAANQREKPEFLWLGLYMAVVALGRVNLYLQIDPNPVTALVFGTLLLTIVPMPLLSQFIATWTGQRWLVWPTWLISALAACFRLEARSGAFLLGWSIALLAVIALARHFLHNGRDRFLVPVLLLVIYTHASSWLGLRDFGIPALVQTNTSGWISFGFVWHLMSTTLLGFVFTVVQVRRLLRDREEKLRLASELEAARNVQQLLHTGSMPGVEAVYEPATEVGGDFYQIVDLGAGELLIVAGDVSGKGLKAAMVVSLLIGAIRAHVRLSPAALLEQLNRSASSGLGGGFVTCIAARFAADGTATLANAGHPHPYRDGVELPLEPGLPLGIAADSQYAEAQFRPGAFTFVSDGVIEATNPAGELFGFERTRALSTKPAREIAGAARAWGAHDDITVIAVRRTAASQNPPRSDMMLPIRSESVHE